MVHYWVIRSEGVVKQVTKHPSQKLSAEKRADLFAVASGEFAAHGFAKSSLNRIISQVGMSKSSFYHYFSNKADLFQQTLENAIEPFLAARDSFDLNALTADTFWSVMESQTREMAVAANQSPELVMIGRMFYRSFDNPEEQALTKDFMEQSTLWLVELIRRGQTLGLLRTDMHENLLFDAFMTVSMAMERWILANWENLSDAERLELSDKSFDMFKRVLKA